MVSEKHLHLFMATTFLYLQTRVVHNSLIQLNDSNVLHNPTNLFVVQLNGANNVHMSPQK